jgi:hypothetical protein
VCLDHICDPSNARIDGARCCSVAGFRYVIGRRMRRLVAKTDCHLLEAIKFGTASGVLCAKSGA